MSAIQKISSPFFNPALKANSKWKLITCLFFLIISVLVLFYQSDSQLARTGAWSGVGVCAVFLVYNLLAKLITDKPQKIVYVNTHSHIRDKFYIGNAHAFINTLHLNVTTKTKRLKTNNKENFNFIVTCCPLKDIYKACPLLERLCSNEPEGDIAFLQGHFLANGIDWVHVGEMFCDNADLWETIAYDCTIDTPSPQRLPEMDVFELANLLRFKRNKIREIDVIEWFEPLLNKIAQAEEQGKKILIHCRAGISRSVTIFMLYLIKRKKMSVDQALHCIKSQRPLADPKFLDKLKAYVASLPQEGK